MDQSWRVLAITLVTAFVVATPAVGAASGAPARFLLLDTMGGLTFVVAGAVAWRRRPEVLTGPVLVLCGALWSIGSYAPTMEPVVTHLGFAFEGWYDVALALLILALPARWPDRRRQRMVAVLVATFGVRSMGRLLLQDPRLYPDAVGFPPNPFAIAPDRVAFETIEVATGLAIAVLCLVVAGIATRRLVAGTPATRRVLWPILVAGGVAMVAAACSRSSTVAARILRPMARGSVASAVGEVSRCRVVPR